MSVCMHVKVSSPLTVHFFRRLQIISALFKLCKIGNWLCASQSKSLKKKLQGIHFFPLKTKENPKRAYSVLKKKNYQNFYAVRNYPCEFNIILGTQGYCISISLLSTTLELKITESNLSKLFLINYVNYLFFE